MRFARIRGVYRTAVQQARRRLEALQDRNARPRRIKRQLARLAKRVAAQKVYEKRSAHKVVVF
jgi:hypothetical protein